MFFSSPAHYLETDTEDLGQLGRGVTSDRQTRTELGPIRSERGHDDSAAWKEGRSKYLEIDVLVILFDEEVEHGSVVPQSESMLWVPGRGDPHAARTRGRCSGVDSCLQSQL